MTEYEKYKPNARELALENGITYPSNEELLMLILGGGTKDNPVEILSKNAVKAINASTQENLVQNLLKIEGIGVSKALQIAAALELGRRRCGHFKQVIDRPQDVIPYVKQFTLTPVENFITVTVNGANEILGIKLITSGSPTRALVSPREVFSDAVKDHASGIICCHNHPSGKCFPSRADINCTRKLYDAAELLNITFLDHLIISGNEYFSFHEHNMFKSREDDA